MWCLSGGHIGSRNLPKYLTMFLTCFLANSLKLIPGPSTIFLDITYKIKTGPVSQYIWLKSHQLYLFINLDRKRIFAFFLYLLLAFFLLLLQEYLLTC